MNEDLKKKIEDLINSNRVFIFMKGEPDRPLCGFSMKTAEALRQVTGEFGFHNVLEDEEMREGIKEYSQWPTLPQVYIDGEFVGGCDIILEMLESGDLKEVIEKTA